MNLNVRDVQQLATYLKETYGITHNNGVVVVKRNAPADGEISQSEESKFEIVLKSAGGNKLQVIKTVKDILGFSLKEAKDFVDAAPKVLKTNVPKDEAENIKNQLINVGADVEVK